ncbi:uracil-DNA glycosylase-like protein [Cristinia sonorae]|uniref:Uracil-DNA glycosylase-like protein n=1 Tax=Cristinia sonorae TaxID=1940300 RepID=A0A8K0UMQ1_9AGAR|nr:uracil-DNA glycosylase-like protein [Cristinia sonorae]
MKTRDGEADSQGAETLKATLDSFKYTTPRRQRVAPILDDEFGCSEGIDASSKSRKRHRGDCTVPDNRPRKRRRRIRGFAPPEVYEHLHVLQDYLDLGLDVVLCGINPGYTSADIGHYYAHPTNHFWKCLHHSGLTDRLLAPTEDYTLPSAYNIGLTNLVDRPSVEQVELCKEEMIDAVPSLLKKITKHRPRIVCFLGKAIWLIFAKEATKLCGTKDEDTTKTPPERPLVTSRFFMPTPSPTPSPTQYSPGLSALPSRTPEIRSPYFPSATPSTPPKALTHSPYFTPRVTQGNDATCASRRITETDVLPQLTPSSTPAPIWRRTQKGKFVFDWGLQPLRMVHNGRLGGVDHDEASHTKETLFFVIPSTSARVVSHQLPDKTVLFRALHEVLGDVKRGLVETKDMLILHSALLERSGPTVHVAAQLP